MTIEVEITRTPALLDDKPVTKRLYELDPSARGLYLTLYKQAEKMPHDNQWRYWQGRMCFRGENFLVHCYMRLNHHDFGIKKLSIQREPKIIIN